MSKRFLISEDERNNILSLYTKKGIILEQKETPIKDPLKTINSGNATNDWQVGENLEKDINKIIQSVQNEIFKKITLKVDSTPKEDIKDPFVFSVLNDGKDTDKKITLNYNEQQREDNNQIVKFYSNYLRFISCGLIPIYEYLGPIYENKDYKILFEKFPEVEEFIKKLKVSLRVVPLNGDAFVIGGTIEPGVGEYRLKSKIPFGDKITTNGTGNQSFKIRLNRRLFYNLQIADTKMQLAEIKLPNPAVKPITDDTPTIEIPEGIVFDFVIETKNNFEYDSATLTLDAKKAIDNKINEKFNSIEPKYQTGYLNFIKNKVIPVYAYASIDDDSNAKDGGNFTGNGADGQSCSVHGKGKGLRYEYNQCLSEARAQSVVDYLKTANNEMFNKIKFNPQGLGETCEFSKNCWTPKNPVSNPDATYLDRRFSVNFPKWTADY